MRNPLSQGFYDWYVPKALSSRSTPAWSTAVKGKGSCFSPELGRKLREECTTSVEFFS